MAFESSRSFIAGVAGMLIVLAAVSGWRWNNQRIAANRAAAIETALLSDPVLAALKARDSETFKGVLTLVRATPTLEATDREALVDYAQHVPHFTFALNGYLKSASDRSVMAYAGALVDAAQELGEKDAGLCFAYLYGSEGRPVDFRSALSAKTRSAVSEATVEVIRDPGDATRAVAALNAFAAYEPARPVIDRLQKDYGDDWNLVNQPFGKDKDRAKVCNVTVAFLRGVLDLPPAQAGPLLRHRLRAQG